MINHGNRVQNRTIPVTMEASMSGIAFESLSGIRHFNGYRCQIEFFGWNLRHRMSLSKVEGRFEARGWHLLGGSSTKRYDRHVTTSSVLRTEQQLRVVARPASASPAVGYYQKHIEQLQTLVNAALG